MAKIIAVVDGRWQEAVKAEEVEGKVSCRGCATDADWTTTSLCRKLPNCYSEVTESFNIYKEIDMTESAEDNGKQS